VSGPAAELPTELPSVTAARRLQFATRFSERRSRQPPRRVVLRTWIPPQLTPRPLAGRSVGFTRTHQSMNDEGLEARGIRPRPWDEDESRERSVPAHGQRRAVLSHCGQCNAELGSLAITAIYRIAITVTVHNESPLPGVAKSARRLVFPVNPEAPRDNHAVSPKAPKVLLDLLGTPAKPPRFNGSFLLLVPSASSLALVNRNASWQRRASVDQAYRMCSERRASRSPSKLVPLTRRGPKRPERLARHTVQPSHTCTSFASERVIVKPVGRGRAWRSLVLTQQHECDGWTSHERSLKENRERPHTQSPLRNQATTLAAG